MSHSLLFVGRRLRPDAPDSEAILGATRLLARTLAEEEGVRVAILGLVDEGPRLRRVRRDRLTYYLVNRHRWGQGSRYWRAMRLLVSGTMLLQGMPHLCSINRFFPPLRPLRRADRLALLISVHNLFARPPVLPEGTLILAENQAIAAAARRHYPGHRVETFYPGVEADRFLPRPAEVGRPVRFLFASSPLPEHDTPQREQAILEVRGVPLIVELTRRLAPRLPMETLLLWRKSPGYIRTLLPPQLPIRVEAREVADMPTFWDRFDFYWALFRDAPDVKGMPQSLLEALAKGVPPVVRRGSSWAALLVPRGAALAVSDPPRPEELTVLIEAATQPRRYRELSLAARRTAEELFEVKGQARRFCRLLFGGCDA